ncbi:MAG: alpha/beta hydrolase [Flavobacteriales bacterium]|nr:alpha/beta hydrolase [Flavobacteriales bacterium]
MRAILLIILMSLSTQVWTNNVDTLNQKVVYLFPGQGSDGRLFEDLNLDPSFTVKNIEYIIPEKGASMEEYALALSKQIDTTSDYYLVGVSLGGMLATEISYILEPEKVVLLASAKNRYELPIRYRFQKRFPIYRLFGGRTLKYGAKIMQPIVEPTRSKEYRKVFQTMLNDKDPKFMSRALFMIMNWERKESNEQIIHIHGEKDRTIPIRNVDYNQMLEGGTHLMTLLRSCEISTLLNDVLTED